MDMMLFNTESSEWDVVLSEDLIWRAYHTWTDDKTDRVDGYLRDSKGVCRQLDIASLGDTCCLINTPVDQVERAIEAWNEGYVFMADPEHHGVDTLVVPFPAISTTLVHAALRRFNP